MRVHACVAALLLLALRASCSLDIRLHDDEDEDAMLRTPEGDARAQVSGRALVPGVRAQDWIASARVLLDGDQHVGFIRCACTSGQTRVSDAWSLASGSQIIRSNVLLVRQERFL